MVWKILIPTHRREARVNLHSDYVLTRSFELMRGWARQVTP